MGTNYYMEPQAPCETCKRPFEQKHIGKSSAGWCFGLHVYPEDGINDLADWIREWSKSGSRIVDEYGKAVTLDEMEQRVTKRSGRSPDAAFYSENHAVPGPNGLVRSQVDGRHCIGHGAGTWDLLIGEFS